MAPEFVEISSAGATATICTRGGVVTAWTVPASEGSFGVIDGYQSVEEVEEGDGARAALLAPWSNRIREAKYTWEGTDFDLGPDSDGVREGLHGLFLDRDFEVVSQQGCAVELVASIGEDELATSYEQGIAYPCALELRVRYELARRHQSYALSGVVKVTNRSSKIAPIGLGWHPYIRYDGPREGAYITMPARTQIEVDEALIPPYGARAFQPADHYDPVRGELVLDNLFDLDTAFTDLTSETGSEATCSATLHHGSGATTTLTAGISGSGNRGSGLFHVFTGEPLVHRAGESVALEFCQFMTDAYNRPELAHELAVEPNASATMNLELTHTLPQK